MKMKILLFTFGALAMFGQQTQQKQDRAPMTFFLTSVGSGNGANLGGLAGADAHCQKLAAAAGAGDRTWRAYLFKHFGRRREAGGERQRPDRRRSLAQFSRNDGGPRFGAPARRHPGIGADPDVGADTAGAPGGIVEHPPAEPHERKDHRHFDGDGQHTEQGPHRTVLQILNNKLVDQFGRASSAGTAARLFRLLF